LRQQVGVLKRKNPRAGGKVNYYQTDAILAKHTKGDKLKAESGRTRQTKQGKP
jgi:hypothetical protein